jgi:galactonate dehydratase
MKITNLQVFHVKPRWSFLKISTDEGITGWGEPMVEGRARTVETAIIEQASFLIGKDPLRIEYLWQSMYRNTFYRGGIILTSAISINRALERKKNGFTAFKVLLEPYTANRGVKAYIESQKYRFAKIRKAVGDEIDIAIDFHGRVNPDVAIQIIREIEQYYPLFVEEPCLPENTDELARIAHSVTVPIAAGERLVTRYGFRPLLEAGAVSVLQPDLCHAGGILEVKKIAAMAETYYCKVAPHNPLGPISLAANLQFACCTPNFLIGEHFGMKEGWDIGEGYLKKPFKIKDGYISVSDKPGLGIELDEEVIAERLFDGNWDSPRLYADDDQSIIDW